MACSPVRLIIHGLKLVDYGLSLPTGRQTMLYLSHIFFILHYRLMVSSFQCYSGILINIIILYTHHKCLKAALLRATIYVYKKKDYPRGITLLSVPFTPNPMYITPIHNSICKLALLTFHQSKGVLTLRDPNVLSNWDTVFYFGQIVEN